MDGGQMDSVYEIARFGHGLAMTQPQLPPLWWLEIRSEAKF